MSVSVRQSQTESDRVRQSQTEIAKDRERERLGAEREMATERYCECDRQTHP